jgi:hypothetical protein
MPSNIEGPWTTNSFCRRASVSTGGSPEPYVALPGKMTDLFHITLQRVDLSSKGVFVAKYDTAGNGLWAMGLGDGYPSGLALSDAGDIYVTGSSEVDTSAGRVNKNWVTLGYDDDGVKTTQFPIVRDGILVGLSTNRETAHYINEKESRGCTQATSWPPAR